MSFRSAITWSLGLTLLGIGLLAYYKWSGSFIDANGVLIEEFWALATGTVLFLIGSLSVIILFLIRRLISYFK